MKDKKLKDWVEKMYESHREHVEELEKKHAKYMLKSALTLFLNEDHEENKDDIAKAYKIVTTEAFVGYFLSVAANHIILSTDSGETMNEFYERYIKDFKEILNSKFEQAKKDRIFLTGKKDTCKSCDNDEDSESDPIDEKKSSIIKLMEEVMNL